MSADFSKLMQHLSDSLEAHADRDGLTGVMRAVFLARGGHAPGAACPTAPPLELHEQHCAVNFHDDEDCDCGWAKRNQPAPALRPGTADHLHRNGAARTEEGS